MVLSDSIYGYDRSYLDGSVLTGPQVLAQQVIKRITIATNYMFWDSNTIDVNQDLMAKYGTSDLLARQTFLNHMFSGDPRFTLNAQVTLTGRDLTYTFTIFPTTDPKPIIVTYIPATNTLQVSH